MPSGCPPTLDLKRLSAHIGSQAVARSHWIASGCPLPVTPEKCLLPISIIIRIMLIIEFVVRCCPFLSDQTMSGLWFELVRCLFLLRVLSALLCIGSVCIVVHWLKCKLGKAGIPVHKMARGPWPRRAGSCPRSSIRPPSRGHGPRALGDLRASSSFHSFHFVVSFMNLRSRNVYPRFGHGQRRRTSQRWPSRAPKSSSRTATK